MANLLPFKFVPEQYDMHFSELYTTLYSHHCVGLALLPCLLSSLFCCVASASRCGSLLEGLVVWKLVSALCMYAYIHIWSALNVDTATLRTILTVSPYVHLLSKNSGKMQLIYVQLIRHDVWFFGTISRFMRTSAVVAC